MLFIGNISICSNVGKLIWPFAKSMAKKLYLSDDSFKEKETERCIRTHTHTVLCERADTAFRFTSRQAKKMSGSM